MPRKIVWPTKRRDRWFVIQTNPRSERKAAAELRRAGLRVYIPTRSEQVTNRRKAHRPEMRFKPLLIGYIFVRFPAAMYDRWGTPPFDLARRCQGVRGFVRVADERNEWMPFSVPDKDVRAFIRRQRQREFGRSAVETREEWLARMQVDFPAGSQVWIIDGPFMSFLASLERLTVDGRVEAEANIFGRATRITLELEQIEPDSLASSPRAE